MKWKTKNATQLTSAVTTLNRKIIETELKSVLLIHICMQCYIERTAQKTPQSWYTNTGTCFIQKRYAPPLPYFKVNIYPFPLPNFASIFVAYLWSFRWPNYIITLPRYVYFQLPHLNIPTGLPSDELDKHIQRTSHFLFFSHWNRCSHFRLCWIFHMHSEFSRPIMCNNAIMIISQM